ncbi:MAG: hypothetical protein ABI268_12995, partial [Rhodanobacter sp.]
MGARIRGFSGMLGGALNTAKGSVMAMLNGRYRTEACAPEKVAPTEQSQGDQDNGLLEGYCCANSDDACGRGMSWVPGVGSTGNSHA